MNEWMKKRLNKYVVLVELYYRWVHMYVCIVYEIKNIRLFLKVAI